MVLHIQNLSLFKLQPLEKQWSQRYDTIDFTLLWGLHLFSIRFQNTSIEKAIELESDTGPETFEN